jgi:hypothetical protein
VGMNAMRTAHPGNRHLRSAHRRRGRLDGRHMNRSTLTPSLGRFHGRVPPASVAVRRNPSAIRLLTRPAPAVRRRPVSGLRCP